MPDRYPRSRVGALVAVAAIALAACGSSAKPASSSTSSTSTPPTTSPAPFAADAVIVEVSNGGGLIAPSSRVGQIPSVTVLGDGTVVTPGVISMIYPGPAIVPLLETHISAAKVRTIVADARRLGLLGRPLDFGRAPVSDMDTTNVRIGDGHRVVTQSVYAFDFTGGDNSLTPAQQAARVALRSFVTEVGKLGVGRRPFTPRAVAVFTIVRSGVQPAEPTRTWPIATQPAATASGAQPGCVVVRGAEVAPLLAALARANQNTPWRVGTRTLALGFRPLVTTDHACTL